jgi:hypothetical protein
MRRSTVLALAVIAALLPLPRQADAGVIITPSVPPPGHVGVLPWALMACPASIILSGIVADFWLNRELTAPEAWTCGLLFWIPRPTQQVIKTKG